MNWNCNSSSPCYKVPKSFNRLVNLNSTESPPGKLLGDLKAPQSSLRRHLDLSSPNRLQPHHKARVVVDLSYPPGQSVNWRDTYLGEPFSLRLPGREALLDIIHQKGQHCHLFKKDLSRAYRQLCIDPRDYHLLGYQYRDCLYSDTAPPFGLRSSAMMCQTTTSAVTFITRISATLVLTALTISGEQRILP